MITKLIKGDVSSESTDRTTLESSKTENIVDKEFYVREKEESMWEDLRMI